MELIDQSRARLEQGDAPGAHALLLQALHACQAIGDRAGGAAVLQELGHQARRRSDLAAAGNLLRQAIQLHLAAGDRNGWVESVYELGLLEQERGEVPLATDMFARALYTARQAGNSLYAGRCLHAMALIHLQAQEYTAAHSLFNDARDARLEAGDDAGESATLHELGMLSEAEDDLFAAADYYKQSLVLCEQLGDEAGQSANLNRLGAIYLARHRPGEAERVFRQAVEIAKASARPDLLAQALHNVGTALYARRDYLGAFECLWEAHRLVPDAEQASWLGALYEQLGPEAFLAHARQLGVDTASLAGVLRRQAPHHVVAQPPSTAQLVALRLRVGRDEFSRLAMQGDLAPDLVARVEEAAQSLGG